MKKTFAICVLAAITCVSQAHVFGQATGAPGTAATKADASITTNGVIGEVTTIDQSAKQLTVKTEAGSLVQIIIDEKTTYMRVPPGEKSLDKAVRVTLAEVGVGDRVYARGKVAEDQKSIPARAVVLMTKADITQKQEHDRAEWQRRGVVGSITALDPATKEITLLVRSREGTQPMIIAAASENVRFRRYAPGSVKFGDAKPGEFAELKVGDQLRALGEKSADGARFTPEEIVSGSFRTVGGAVTAVDSQSNEIKVNDVQSRRPLTITISRDSVLRRIPPEMAAMFAQQGTGAPPAGGAQPGQTGGGPSSPLAGRSSNRPPGAPEGEVTGSRRGMMGSSSSSGGGGGGIDLQQILERLPVTTIAELKPGDMIIMSSTASPDPSRVTAIALVSGVEALLSRTPQRRGGSAGETGDSGLGGISLGIGLP